MWSGFKDVYGLRRNKMEHLPYMEVVSRYGWNLGVIGIPHWIEGRYVLYSGLTNLCLYLQ